MFFTKKQTYHFAVQEEELRNRLSGKHIKIHDLDFEILELDQKLRIVPHAESVDSIRTLPITKIEFKNKGDQTWVCITSKMRRLDSGGPILLLSFCFFLLGLSFFLFEIYRESTLCYLLLGLTALILTIFGIRMQTGYFDYVRKVHHYIRDRAGQAKNGNTLNFA